MREALRREWLPPASDSLGRASEPADAIDPSSSLTGGQSVLEARRCGWKPPDSELLLLDEGKRSCMLSELDADAKLELRRRTPAMGLELSSTLQEEMGSTRLRVLGHHYTKAHASALAISHFVELRR